ncbi:MAG: UDP-N-acetylmuramoylalanyl-D-glutamyl-2, 6-diaminopimelate--D-alanyl-D-alanine ligase, partial [Rhizobiaceae bacterium]|nr:UDP-N-acetylmuramoylalanyl-D-glutamyl-2, 6-diaminopimelate--D-alanyl-D-alanine ligase [Rhizobiaceae bacterium]
AGRHIVCNALAVLLAVKLAGEDIHKAAKALATQEAIIGRGKREYLDIGERKNPVTLIDESYNANPASMAAALNVLAMHSPTGKGRRVAVLGDMLELGKSSNKLHKELAESIRAAKIDRVWLAGKEILPLADDLSKKEFAGYFENAKAMEEALVNDLLPGDVVMFKASLGIKFGPLVEAVKKQLAGN